MVDRTEYKRWLAAADDALRAARTQAEAGSHHWACFLAEQAAHPAIKGAR